MNLKKFTKLMKALSDPNRVKIVKMLQKRTLCVCEMQAALGIAQSTVSKHLKILEEAEIVGFKKNGQWIDYFLISKPHDPFVYPLLRLLERWLEDDKEIFALLNSLKNIDRIKIKNSN